MKNIKLISEMIEAYKCACGTKTIGTMTYCRCGRYTYVCDGHEKRCEERAAINRNAMHRAAGRVFGINPDVWPGRKHGCYCAYSYYYTDVELIDMYREAGIQVLEILQEIFPVEIAGIIHDYVSDGIADTLQHSRPDKSVIMSVTYTGKHGHTPYPGFLLETRQELADAIGIGLIL
jgi:hypothetical protein